MDTIGQEGHLVLVSSAFFDHVFFNSLIHDIHKYMM